MVIAGKYRLETQVGQGGMGEVWVATNLVLDSKIALKVLLRSLLDNAEAGERLLREARAAARISHRNIVQVYDFGYVETGEPFIVMELLRGESLGDRLARVSRLPAVQAVEILVPVAHALATAHAKGIVHRDLKPGNVFLAVDESNAETPKVVDFGIAKMKDAKHQSRVTQDGNVMGSPEYLSPEQAIGEADIDARADVWALSVTLYESITGRLPFDDPSYNRLLHMIVEDNPVPTTELGAGDAELWTILEKGLHKKRDERWQSVFEMGAALEEWLRSHGVYITGGTFARVVETGDGSGRNSVITGPRPSLSKISTGDGPVSVQFSSEDIIADDAEQARKRRFPVVGIVVGFSVLAGVTAGLLLFRFGSQTSASQTPGGPASVQSSALTATPPVASASASPAPDPSAVASTPKAEASATSAAKAKAAAGTGPGVVKVTGKAPGKAGGTNPNDDVYGSRR